MVTAGFSPTLSFLSGIPLHSSFPLTRFLPPYYRYTVSTYLEELFPQNTQDTGYILDPYGASPLIPIELANVGAAVLVCCNNPILGSLIRIAALCPQINEFQNILAEISALKKIDIRLETFLRSLYYSVCNICFSEIEVNAYIWERDSTSGNHRLISKQYHCLHCGNEGQFPVTTQDQQQLHRLPPRALIEAQAASKVVEKNDLGYPSVIEALSVYPTRSLYAIITLLNKLDELNLDQRQQQILTGLLIEAFDLSTSLWAYPSKRHRPKQISLPTQFYEYNFWQSLEKSKDTWVNSISEINLSPIIVYEYPQKPCRGEISIFNGRLRELLPQISKNDIAAVVTTLPRPNQAFWMLSAIWSGWLEGREKVKPLKSALVRKRYDWGWHCRALNATLQELSDHLSENTPCFALIEEYEANFLAAALLAADHAGLRLENLTLRSDQGRAQIQWRTSSRLPRKVSGMPDAQKQLLPEIEAYIANMLQAHIEQTLEPVHFAQLHAVALANAVHSIIPEDKKTLPINSILEIVPFQTVTDYPNFFLTVFENATRSSSKIVPLGGDDKSFDTRLWWITEPNLKLTPISDQVEQVTFDYLLSKTSATFFEIDQVICQKLKRISAPPLALIRECLESYAEYDQNTHKWTLHAYETPIHRDRDLFEIRRQIISLGKRLNYSIKDSLPLIWMDKENNPTAIWLIQTHAHIGNILRVSSPEIATYVAIPGSRVNLILYKIQMYPFLQQMIEKQIHIIRFRQIRWMITQTQINRSLFKEWIKIEPLKYQSSQLSLW